MKPHRIPIADGLAAQHCEALWPKPASPDTQIELLARPLKRLARLLPEALAPFMGDAAPQVVVDAPQIATSGELIDRIGTLAANAVLDDGQGVPAMLLSIEAAAIFAQLDRAFGGSGAPIDPLPSRFPVSADLLINRIAEAVTGVLGTALRLDNPSKVVARYDNLAGIRDSLERERFVIVPITFGSDRTGHNAMTLALSLPLLARVTAAGKAGRTDGARSIPCPLDAPFGDLPLRLDACLVDMRVSLTTIANLRPGSVMPVAVARLVPLSIGSTTVAHGAVGEVDDRVALRLAPLSPSGQSAPDALQEYRA